MQTPIEVLVLSALRLTTNSVARAQQGPDLDNRSQDQQQHGNQSDQRDNRDNNGNRRDHREDRGAGPNHAYRKGQRPPSQYRTRQSVVQDWRGSYGRAPPREYHWARSGSDYLLVAMTTGVILELLLNS